MIYQYHVNSSLFIQISNSGFEFHMRPASGEAATVMTLGQQWEMNEAVTAVSSQTVSFTCSLNLRYGFDCLD